MKGINLKMAGQENYKLSGTLGYSNFFLQMSLSHWCTLDRQNTDDKEEKQETHIAFFFFKALNYAIWYNPLSWHLFFRQHPLFLSVCSAWLLLWASGFRKNQTYNMAPVWPHEAASSISHAFQTIFLRKEALEKPHSVRAVFQHVGFILLRKQLLLEEPSHHLVCPSRSLIFAQRNAEFLEHQEAIQDFSYKSVDFK